MESDRTGRALPAWPTLIDELCGFIADAYEPVHAPSSAWPASRITRAAFLDMARRVLRHQAAHNPGYARYARRLGVDLDRLEDPLDAPPVPTDAFKRRQLCAFDPAEAVACFRSSGTTAADRSEHRFRTLDVYRASIAPPFVRYVLPDLGPAPTIPMIILAPSAAQAPDSSLYFMFDVLRRRFGLAMRRRPRERANKRLQVPGAPSHRSQTFEVAPAPEAQPLAGNDDTLYLPVLGGQLNDG